MNNVQHTVSVIIPVYNQAIYIGEAIESILSQTQKVDEMIIVNDGSTDDLTAALKPFNEFIRITSHETNKGVAAARNTGVRNAIYDIILFQDADDISALSRVELSVKAFEIEDVHFVRGMLQNINAEDQDIDSLYSEKKDLLPKHCYGSGIMAIRKDFFNKVGMFDEKLRSSEDLDWEMRALKFGVHPYLCNELFVRRRLHSKNTSSLTYLGLKEAQESRLSILRKNLISKRNKNE